MRKYETFFIEDPDLPDEAIAVLDTKVQSIVTSNGGEVLTYVPWGKRKLAYAIGKRTRGLYVLMEYCGGSQLVAELERNLRIDERVPQVHNCHARRPVRPGKGKGAQSSGAAAAAVPFHEEEETEGALLGGEDEEEMPEDLGLEGLEDKEGEEDEE